MDEFNIAVMESMGYNPNDLDDDVRMKFISRIEACKSYLIGGGMPKRFIEEVNPAAVSCVAIGANDISDERPGDTDFSPAFKIFARQLTSRSK